MEIKFTNHPLLKPPTDEEIVMLGEEDPKLLADLHKAHEGRIEAATDDPIRYGFDLDGNFSRSTGVSAEVVNGIVTNRRLYY